MTWVLVYLIWWGGTPVTETIPNFVSAQECQVAGNALVRTFNGGPFDNREVKFVCIQQSKTLTAEKP